jgi:hypothetical protein
MTFFDYDVSGGDDKMFSFVFNTHFVDEHLGYRIHFGALPSTLTP